MCLFTRAPFWVAISDPQPSNPRGRCALANRFLARRPFLSPWKMDVLFVVVALDLGVLNAELAFRNPSGTTPVSEPFVTSGEFLVASAPWAGCGYTPFSFFFFLMFFVAPGFKG